MDTIRIVDSESNLENLIDLINYVSVDGLVINGLLGEKIIQLAQKSKEKNIKIIVLIPEIKDYEEQEFISILVGYGVTAFLSFDEINRIEQIFNNYPKEFNFEAFNAIEEDNPRKKIFQPNISKMPKDYQKVIGIFSGSATGKTTLSVNLAEAYAKHGIQTVIIDTDYIKKDLLHYYNIDFGEETGQYKKLIEAIRLKEDINVTEYAISISKHLKIFTDSKEAEINGLQEAVDTLVKQLKANIIIIDISQHLSSENINQMLMLCDEKLMMIDQMIPSIKHALDLLEKLNRVNREISIIINKHHKIKTFKNKHIIGIFCNKHNQIKNTFHISDQYKLLLDSIAEVKRAYGTDDKFDEEIEKIANAIYTIKSNKKGLFRKWMM